MADKIKTLAKINLLSELETGNFQTQQALSQKVSLSIGMVNIMLKRAVAKGFVKVKSAPYKRYTYYLTPTGFREKSKLVSEYLESSLDFFRMAKQQYATLLEKVSEQTDQPRILFYGEGELVEIAILAAQQVNVPISGICAPHINTAQYHTLPVLRDIVALDNIDAIILVETRHPLDVYHDIQNRFPDKQILAPEFLKIRSIDPYKENNSPPNLDQTIS